MILLSLASKQIWPHVLTVAHLKPDRLFLLHSEDAGESRSPAQRLKRFFDDSNLVPRGGTRLEQISDFDFEAVERRLDELQRTHELPLAECVVNFTGGNKLMATAAFRWAARHALGFYLERRNQLSWFTAPDGKMITRTEPLDGHITDNLDPVALLRCQMDASEIERPGQSITLSEEGRRLNTDEFSRRIYSDVRRLLKIDGETDREEKQGDSLEFATAAVLLKLGVKNVQRSLRLKVKSTAGAGTRKPHAEVDLLFTWDGRLWLVDCKDQKPVENLCDKLMRCQPPCSADAEEIIERMRGAMAMSHTKAMKEDLLAASEVGGLLGNILCVRKSQPPEEVRLYAKHNKIEIIAKNDLFERLDALLHPNQAAAPELLKALAGIRTAARV